MNVKKHLVLTISYTGYKLRFRPLKELQAGE
jgi:hypothetical protein